MNGKAYVIIKTTVHNAGSQPHLTSEADHIYGNFADAVTRLNELQARNEKHAKVNRLDEMTLSLDFGDTKMIYSIDSALMD